MTEQEIDSLRERMLKVAYNKYSMAEFKTWAVDKVCELAQQIVRINTKKYDVEELIRVGLMAEDVVCMIWMLLDDKKQQIHEAKEDIYQEFDNMVKEEQCKLCVKLIKFILQIVH
jgi:hypothetical protein